MVLPLLLLPAAQWLLQLCCGGASSREFSWRLHSGPSPPGTPQPSPPNAPQPSLPNTLAALAAPGASAASPWRQAVLSLTTHCCCRSSSEARAVAVAVQVEAAPAAAAAAAAAPPPGARAGAPPCPPSPQSEHLRLLEQQRLAPSLAAAAL